MKAFFVPCFRRGDDFRQMAEDKGAVLPLGRRIRFVFDYSNDIVLRSADSTRQCNMLVMA